MPRIELPSKLGPIATTKARLIVIIGGRSSGKSEGIGRFLLMRAQTEGADVLCGREFQASIDDSVHKLLKSLVDKLGMTGADVTDKKIDFSTGGGFRFKGFARNSDAVKSAQDFKYSWIEEAQSLSQESIDDLLPTIRAEGSQLFFTANPQSSGDAFSQRFIVPFQKELDRDGIYEDDMHLVIKMNYMDNPWHGELEMQRQWDYDHLPRAKYDWIWMGSYNDSVDNSIIDSVWFDAAIDAHKDTRFADTFKALGARIIAHDPSDTGTDAKGYAYRHGSIIKSVKAKDDGDIADGCDWATGLARANDADIFAYDCDGMGVGLKRQVSLAFSGTHIKSSMFRGSLSGLGQDNAELVYHPTDLDDREPKTYAETFKNNRAQYYWALRNRFYNTYRCIALREYVDPTEMLSLDSAGIEDMPRLRSEVCRIPLIPNANGLIQIMDKKTMAKQKPPIPSPNMADALMMTMITPKSKPMRKPIKVRSYKNPMRG